MKIKELLESDLFRHSLIYTVCDAINKAVPFFILPILSHFLLPSDYGVIANFSVILSVVSIFVMIAIDGAIGVNYYKYSKEELSKFIFNGFCWIFSSFLLFCLLSFVFQQEIYDLTKIPLLYQLKLIVMAFAATITSINLSLWRLEEKPMSFGIYQIAQTIVSFTIIIVLVIIYKEGWKGNADGLFFSTVLFGLFSLILLFKRGYFKPHFSKMYINEILVFGLPLIPHALSIWIRSGIDRLYITNFIGETATGLYATGFQFGILVSFLTMSFNNAFVPYLYKNLSESNKDLLETNKRKLVRLTYLIILGLICVSLIFIFVSNIILEYFFSEKYFLAKEFIIWAILSQMF